MCFFYIFFPFWVCFFFAFCFGLLRMFWDQWEDKADGKSLMVNDLDGSLILLFPFACFPLVVLV